jgi:hypothetical protein
MAHGAAKSAVPEKYYTKVTVSERREYREGWLTRWIKKRY